MQTDKKKLMVFGYGLAVMIPFFLWVHSVKIGSPFLPLWGFIVAVFVIFFVLSKIEKIFLLYYAILAGTLYLVVKQAPGTASWIWLILAAIILTVSLINVTWLEPVYRQWMRVAHLIGTVVAGVMFSVLFYVVFGIAGLILRLCGKDLLDRRIDPGAKSYWQERKGQGFNKDSYENQF